MTARAIFMGSPAFAVPTLRALHRDGITVVRVITQPDRTAGRGRGLREPPVKVVAGELGLEISQPDTLKDPALAEELSGLHPDVIVVAAYGKILPRSVLAIPRRGSLNVHASLLPRWRGASPIAAAIKAGDRETGVTIMEMVAKMDAGPILGSEKIQIDDDATTGTLEPRLAELGASLLLRLLPPWLAGELTPRPQDESRATYCWTLTKADGHLSRKMTAIEAERAVRAYNPWPGAYVEYGPRRLTIWRAHVENATAPPGTMTKVGGRAAIAFREGLLVLDEVQLPGRRRIAGDAFVNGERGRLLPEVRLA